MKTKSTAKSRYLGTYRTVRSMAFIWYLLAAFCFYKAIAAFSSYESEPSIVEFMMWCGACVGLIVAARRSKKTNNDSAVN